MRHLPFAAGLVALAGACVGPAGAGVAQPSGQRIPEAPGHPAPSYADIADLAVASPIVLDAAIRSTSRIKGAEAAGVASGMVRLYVTADVLALIRGLSAIPPRIGYLLDTPLDARGRPPSLKKLRVLLFARPVPERPDQIQLIDPSAQRDWSPAVDSLVRQVVRELLAPDAPPVVTGVGNAFHVPGSLPGEGETQIFLTTADNRPISLSVLHRPGEEPRWAVALSEIVDDSAATPRRDTLLWYRLACFLPPALPERSTQTLEPDDAELARRDYAFVLAQLGPCLRGREPI